MNVKFVLRKKKGSEFTEYNCGHNACTECSRGNIKLIITLG